MTPAPGQPATSRSRSVPPASALRLHATTALATKLGGFTPAPPAETDPTPLSTWYAHLIRRRKPRVIAVDTSTLMTVIVPLAPASTFFDRLPAYVAAQLDSFGIPHDFIHAHVDRIAGPGTVLKTADRTMVGIINHRMRYLDSWDIQDEDEWLVMAENLSTTITMALGEPHHGADRLFGVVRRWEAEFGT